MASTTAVGEADTQRLDDLISRLSAREVMSGLLLMGTTGTAALTPTHDPRLTTRLDVYFPTHRLPTSSDSRSDRVHNGSRCAAGDGRDRRLACGHKHLERIIVVTPHGRLAGVAERRTAMRAFGQREGMEDDRD